MGDEEKNRDKREGVVVVVVGGSVVGVKVRRGREASRGRNERKDIAE